MVASLLVAAAVEVVVVVDVWVLLRLAVVVAVALLLLLRPLQLVVREAQLHQDLLHKYPSMMMMINVPLILMKHEQ